MFQEKIPVNRGNELPEEELALQERGNRGLCISLLEGEISGETRIQSPTCSLQIELFLQEHPGSYVKFSDTRTRPYLFSKEYDNFLAEYVVLEKMYELCPEHVVKPIMMAPGNRYYRTEYYPHAQKLSDWPMEQRADLLRRQPEVFDEIMRTLKLFHDNGVAHGDISGNMLISLTEDGSIGDWILLDPVGIDSQDENFSAACEKDLHDLEQIRSWESIPLGDTPTYIPGGETPQMNNAPDSQRKIADPFFDPEVSWLTPEGKSLCDEVKRKLTGDGIHLTTIDNPYAFRDLARRRNETIGETFVARVDLLAKMMHALRGSFDARPFDDVSTTIAQTISELSEEDRQLISESLLVALVEKSRKYNHRLQAGLKFIEETFRYPELGDEHIQVAMVGCSVGIFFDESNLESILRLDATEEYANSIAGSQDDQNLLHNSGGFAKEEYLPDVSSLIGIMFIPKDNISYALNHESQHAGLNKVVFERILQFGEEDCNIKEEIVAYLSDATAPEEIHRILTQDPLYQFSNYANYNDAIWTVRKLSSVYDLRTLADVLSIVPLAQWKKFTQLVFQSKGEYDPESPLHDITPV
jgi:hypothetical protein